MDARGQPHWALGRTTSTDPSHRRQREEEEEEEEGEEGEEGEKWGRTMWTTRMASHKARARRRDRPLPLRERSRWTGRTRWLVWTGSRLGLKRLEMGRRTRLLFGPMPA
jgi:hypothetical protein